MNGSVRKTLPKKNITRGQLASVQSTSSSGSRRDSGEDCPYAFYDDKTVEEALTLVDDINERKFSIREECYLTDSYSHDSRRDAEEVVGEKERQSQKSKIEHKLQKGSKTSQPRTPKRKKRRRRRRLTICTTNCKYDVVRQIAARFGMKEVAEDEPWNLYWTDLSVSVERAKEMKRFQKINHFPGMSEICRKDLLARNLNRMLKIFPKDFNFFPKTWCLPADFGEAIAYSRARRNKTYICKPETGCQGRGIFLTKNLKDIKPYDRMICQIYISKPFLVDGFKFDLRVYTLITSCDPLRIFVYNEGLVRFATSRYREPTHSNTTNVFMHLTNYAVNKHSRTFVVDDEAGSKRKISTLNRYLQMKDYNTKELWTSIDDVIIKTVLAAHPMLKHSYHACFPSHDYTYACFEILGFDILLDHKMKPYILEVNHSPSFHTDSQIDRDVKENLLMDTFEILNLSQTDKRKVMEEDRRRVRERLLQGILSKDVTHEMGNAFVPGKNAQEAFKAQLVWEERHLGNFRCVYPSSVCEKYDRFFNQNQSSLFQETAASRAREECARMQRVELESKAKQEAARRPAGKPREGDRLERPESPRSKLKVVTATATATAPRKKSSAPIQSFSQGATSTNEAPTICGSNFLNTKLSKPSGYHSFDPEPINESEERERVAGLAQRDFLIRSYGVLEQVYYAMQKNGSLRPEDEKKYGMISRSGQAQELNPTIYNDLAALQAQRAAQISKSQAVSRNIKYNSGLPPANVNIGFKKPNISESVVVQSHAHGLSITCDSAPLFNRPPMPQAIWIDDKKEHEGDIRFTKSHLARTLTNSMKLQGIEKRKNHANNEN